MKYAVLSLGLVLGGMQLATAEPLTVDYAKSSISFSGKHAGNEFSGKFNEWSAELDFNFDEPEQSKLKATFELASAETGNTMYDGTLPTADWFDVKNTPQGFFESTKVVKVEGNLYKIDGTLTLKGREQLVSFDAQVLEGSDGKREAESSFVINRLDYGLGEKSDPNLDWVDNEIVIKMHILASE